MKLGDSESVRPCRFSRPDKSARRPCSYLLKQSEEIARQLRKANVKAKTIDTPTRSSETIYRHAASLLDSYQLTQKIRLIGVGTSGFKSTDRPVQLNLFDRINESDKTWEKVDRTVETITKKFGRGAIKRGTLSEK